MEDLKEKKNIEEECCGEDCNCEEKGCDCEDCNCEEEGCDCDDCNDDEECCGEGCNCEEGNNVSELELAIEKIKNLEDALLRSKAEFVNYKKRLSDEQSRLLKFSNEDLIKEVLPVIDNFERAINMDDNHLNDEVSKFLAGFKLIYCNMLDILKKYEVVEIDGINKPFNPTYHEAIMVEKIDKMASGLVVDVLQKGYILKGKVIRPAMVKVSE